MTKRDSTVIICHRGDVVMVAIRESKRRSVHQTEVWFCGAWLCTYVNGKRAFGAADRMMGGTEQ